VTSNRKPSLVIAGVVVAAVVAVVVAMAALGGGPGTATKAEYQETIVNARDRTDFAFAQITKADSVENLIERLDEAGAAVGDVSGDVSGAAVAEGFEDLNDRLADKLEAFSGALQATADQFEDPSSAGFGLENINSLGFSEWDDVNAVLTEMQDKGLEVELLGRH
jgi:ABC-type transporter Mla subunit MlaD